MSCLSESGTRYGTKTEESTSFCKNPDCKKASWIVWWMEHKIPKCENSTTLQEDAEMNQENGMIYHAKCYSYWQLKHELEKVIIEGSQRFCHGWGTGGIKDYNCTHMKWSKWKVIYCYCWGVE